jgi:small subunit ribosomal protein S28e
MSTELGYPARVVEIVGRTGTRGEVLQVRCEVLEGQDAGKVLIRNVRGPVKVDDTLMLLDTVMQARRLEARRK